MCVLQCNKTWDVMAGVARLARRRWVGDLFMASRPPLANTNETKILLEWSEQRISPNNHYRSVRHFFYISCKSGPNIYQAPSLTAHPHSLSPRLVGWFSRLQLGRLALLVFSSLAL